MGLIRLGVGGDDYFHAAGPNDNIGYTMCSAHGQIYTANGGRWAVQNMNIGKINIFNGTTWKRTYYSTIRSKTGQDVRDIVSIAVDPSDAGHFFAATYGTGVYEFRNYEGIPCSPVFGTEVSWLHPRL